MNLPYYQYAPARGGLSRHIGVTFLVAYKANKSTIVKLPIITGSSDARQTMLGPIIGGRCSFEDGSESVSRPSGLAGFNIEHVLASKADAEARKP